MFGLQLAVIAAVIDERKCGGTTKAWQLLLGATAVTVLSISLKLRGHGKPEENARSLLDCS